MTTYTKSTDFASKDALLTGNPSKVVKGVEINTEFDNIAAADATNLKSGGALGTPSSGTVTNLTGTANISITGTATNIAGGAGGRIPYQSAANTTALLANGTAGQLLTSNGTTLAPSWTTVTADVAAQTHAAASKTTPVDADELPVADSAATWGLKKLTWSNIKATLKTYFDTLYQAADADLTSWAGIAPSAKASSGANSDITSLSAIASINGGQISHRNRIINGGFDVWQRGTSIATSTGGTTGYAADRWQLARTSWAAGATATRQAGEAGSQYCIRVQRDSGNTSTSNIYISQYLETVNSIPLQGKSITLSFRARAGANYSAASSLLNVGLITGTGTDQNHIAAGFTGASSIASQNVTLTSSFQTFSITGTVASGATQVGIQIATTPVGTAGAADYFELSQVQLEVGNTASSFEFRPNELQLCQRYYYRVSMTTTSTAFGPFASYATNSSGFLYSSFPVAMRVPPTSLEQSGTAGNYQIFLASVATACTSVPTFGNATTTNAITSIFATSGHTAGQVGHVASVGGSSPYLGWSAEL